MFIGIAATVVAAGTAVAVALPWFAGTVNAEAFADILIKLAKAGNLDRAEKLCHAAPRSIFVVASARCLAALGTASDSDAEAIAQLRDTFVGAVRDGVRRRQRGGWLTLISLAAAAIAVYVVAVDHLHPGVLAGAGLAVLLLAFAWNAARRLARDTVTHGERIYSALVASRGRS